MVLDSVLFKERIVNGWEASLISSKQKISTFYIMMCSSPLRFHYCIALPSLRISFTLNNSPWIHSLQKFTFPNISAINEPRTSCWAKLHYKQEYKTFLNELSLDFFFSFFEATLLILSIHYYVYWILFTKSPLRIFISFTYHR